MSQVLEAPKPEVFTPVTYYNQRQKDVTTPRWVGFPGDLIVPERKAEISWLKVGGEETPSSCLQRYGRGFVPRGRAAILELGGEPIPMRHLGELQSVAWQGVSLADEQVKNKFGFVPVFPGDGLRVLKRYSMNPVRKGLDEITSLEGKSWEECHDQDGTGILDFIETAMFGDGMEPTLRGFEDQIRHAVINDSRIDGGKYKSEWLTLCSDYRNWGMRLITIENGLLTLGSIPVIQTPTGQQGGWAYAYSPICKMVMQQLEATPQDQPMHEMSKLIEKMVLGQSQSGMSAADLDLIEQRMEARLAQAREADARRIRELEAQINSASGEPIHPDVSRETFICDNEGCGKESPTLAGKMAHQRFCKAANPLNTTEK